MAAARQCSPSFIVTIVSDAESERMGLPHAYALLCWNFDIGAVPPPPRSPTRNEQALGELRMRDTAKLMGEPLLACTRGLPPLVARAQGYHQVVVKRSAIE